MPAHGRLAVDRQQLAIPPHRPRPACNRLPGQRRADRIVVVRDLERPEVVRTEIERFLGIELAAEATLQPAHEFSHRRFSFDSGPILPGQRAENQRKRSDDPDGNATARAIRVRIFRRGKLDRYRSGDEGKGEDKEGPGPTEGLPQATDHLICPIGVFLQHGAERRWAGVSTSIRRDGEPVAVASQGPSLSHSG